MNKYNSRINKKAIEDIVFNQIWGGEKFSSELSSDSGFKSSEEPTEKSASKNQNNFKKEPTFEKSHEDENFKQGSFALKLEFLTDENPENIPEMIVTERFDLKKKKVNMRNSCT